MPKKAKMYVLDTNTMMHDPTCVFKFDEHDVFIPMMALEELDAHKNGMSEVARNTRQVTRLIDDLVADEKDVANGISLREHSSGMATGRLYLQTEPLPYDLPMVLPAGKGDNQILSVVAALKNKQPRRHVVLVSKDINIRIKAKSLGMEAEDYRNDMAIDDADLLPVGIVKAPYDFWDTHGKNLGVTKEGKKSVYKLSGPLVKQMKVNQFLWVEQDDFVARVTGISGRTMTMQTITDFRDPKHAVCGISAKNIEQMCAFDLLMDPEVDMVSLMGQAGTGKTLLALVAGICQTHKTNKYDEIIVTRATVPVGDDIGFLPGDEVDKMQPWMGAIEDNKSIIAEAYPEIAKPNAMGQVNSRIKVRSMAFMRGRTFIRKYLIIDEAQNLTPKQMRTMVTRAGPGTKIVCLGNIKQIDTPYLTEGGSGLTYVVDRLANWQHAGSLILQNCVRSRLADYATGVL